MKKNKRLLALAAATALAAGATSGCGCAKQDDKEQTASLAPAAEESALPMPTDETPEEPGETAPTENPEVSLVPASQSPESEASSEEPPEGAEESPVASAEPTESPESFNPENNVPPMVYGPPDFGEIS